MAEIEARSVRKRKSPGARGTGKGREREEEKVGARQVICDLLWRRIQHRLLSWQATYAKVVHLYLFCNNECKNIFATIKVIFGE
jgi:hypothetical protein